jgi:hypothetical protein
MKYSKIYILLFVSIFIFTGFCKADNPINKSNNTWTQCNDLKNLRVTGFGVFGNNIVAGAFFSSGSSNLAFLYLSSDTGTSWAAIDTIIVDNHHTGWNFSLICSITFFTNDTDILAGIGGGYSGNVFISTDKGMSWSNNGIVWIEKDTIFNKDINCFAKSNENLFAGTNHGVFISSDNGKNWNSADTGFSYQVMRLAVIGPDLFSGTGYGVYRSMDNGASWMEVNNGLPTFSDVYGITSIGSNLFTGVFGLVDSTSGVFISTNYGESWSARNSGLSNHMINILTTYGNYLFAGTNRGIFMSSDLGISWSNIGKGSIVDSLGVEAISICDTYLFIGNNSGVWRCSLSNIVGVSDQLPSVPQGYSLFQNYPNPFNPNTVIKYQLPSNIFVCLEVYNELGMKIKTLINEQQNIGMHSVNFNAGNLPSGVYFYKLTAGIFIETKKLMIIK